MNTDYNFENKIYDEPQEEQVPEEVRYENKRLCDFYPFLIPFNRFSGKRITTEEKGYWPGNPDTPPPKWNYEYTELDDMPDGWRKAFGEQLCADVKDALLDEGGEKLLDEYRVEQIKEKFGYLHWYGNFTTRRLETILEKYEVLSEHTCISCGKPATKMSKGWISPYCDDCATGNPSEYITLSGDEQ